MAQFVQRQVQSGAGASWPFSPAPPSGALAESG